MGDVVALDRPEPEFDSWEAFWSIYPRREAKKDAIRAWNKISPDLHAEILTALYHWRRVWVSRGSNFLPLPATWLNGERWTDELPEEFTSASHKNAVIPQVGKRSEMPQYVKDFIASRLKR